MKRITGSPIIINGSAFDDDFRALVKAIDAWLTPEQRDVLIRRSTRLAYVKDDRPEARIYEERVRALLESRILRTEIGKALLSALPRHIPIWIIRYNALIQENRGECNAVTGQMSSRLSDGVRILYSPETWFYTRCGHTPGYRSDEVLLHEMVHAVRFACFGFEGMNHEPLRDNDDHEEFLSVQMNNVYRSETGGTIFKHHYTSDKLGTQAEVERTLSSPDLVQALEYFLSDPFVAAVAQIKTAFNPFRDVARLKEQSYQRDLRQLRTW